MSWIQRLYDTYKHLNNEQEEKIPPLSHIEKQAHIEITLNNKGEIVNIKTLTKDNAKTIIQVTEESARRTGGIAPHPLCEELGYLANNLPIAKKNKEKNEAFMQLLKNWSRSNTSSHIKVKAIYEYLFKNTILEDIEKTGIQFPLKIKSLSIEKEKAFVRWRVESFGDLTPETWKDKSLIQAWIDYENSLASKKGFCYLTGNPNVRLANGHQKAIRNAGDGARIISQNDFDGFTFRGRFTDDKNQLISQVCEIGFETTHKSHNTLRWLIDRQGIRNDSQVTIAWAVSGKPLLNPVSDWSDLDHNDEDSNESSELQKTESTIAHSEDLGFLISQKIRLKLNGYQQKLNDTDQLSLMVLDSATPGRIAIQYYREFLPREYFDKINTWYENFCWYQRINKEFETTDAKGKNKKTHKTLFPIMPPSPLLIVQSTYASEQSGDAFNKYKKQVYARVLPCIVEGTKMPLDLLRMAIQRASNPMAIESWEFERNVGVACALFKGFSFQEYKKEYSMALDEQCTSRDYLYGRLLAVAERIESIALNVSGEKRRTTAERYMQQFSAHPYQTWKQIELALDPYKSRLRNIRTGFLINSEKEITDIHNLFNKEDYSNDGKLSGEFLLGYHCQKMKYRKNKDDSSDEELN